MLVNKIRFVCVAATLGIAVASSQALIVTSYGSSLGTGDDSTFSYTLGGTFNFYGSGFTTVGVCTNGFLTPGAATYSNFGNAAFPTNATPMIAPLWDDLYVLNTGFFMDGTSTGSYDAFTWNAEHFSGANGSQILMQALLVRSNVTISGFNFLAGDIAFSYDVVNGGTAGITGTVGLNAGDGLNDILGPGTLNGTETGTDIPNYAATGRFFLFRSNGNGGYNASIASPEPASMAALGLGVLALVRRRRNRK